MSIDVIKRFFFAVVLCLVQALVLNRVHLFACAVPLLYVIFPLYFHSGQSRVSALLWCFCLGLAIDVFSNTPGMSSASLTLIALLQPIVLSAFIPRDEEDNFAPSISEMGFTKFFTYALILILVHCTVFFTLEAFSFFDIIQWASAIGGSTALTLFVVIALDKIFR